MKVLMFGWEFPPHISGGLGTACFGLTKSLMDEKVEILFVVPRLFDGEDHQPFLINASRVVRNPKSLGVGLSSESSITDIPEKTRASKPLERGPHGMTYLEIPAALSPYDFPRAGQRTKTHELGSWNYPLRSKGEDRSTIEQLRTNESAATADEADFVFSGTYGTCLMDEVKRYGEVAEIIAGRHGFDVIHVHDWMTFPAGLRARRKSGKPLVVHVHSTVFDRSALAVNKDVLEIEKSGLAAADAIIAVSNWTKRVLISRYHISANKISVVHNGILPRKKIKNFPFPEVGSHFVTFLGRVTHQKGPRFFVEAARKVLSEFPDAHFIVAGAGDLLPQIIERVAQLRMSISFHFTGFLSGSQVDRIWSMTDVYVMPSVSEPFGIAPLEAIQGGVPVILSNQSGVAEVMPHAIKVDFWDTKALAAAICSVLRYESLSHVLRQKSAQHLKYLTWNKAASDVKALYHELTGKD